MKKYLFITAIVAFEAIILAATSCSKHKTQEPDNPYERFVAMFNDSTSYAIVTIDGQELLFISNETYQNEDADHKPIMTAIAAQIYGKDSTGRIIPYGEVRSQGTLYPVSISDGSIVAAGHRYIYKYKVNGSLELIEDASVSYSTDGTATCNYENRDKNEYIDNCSEEKYDSLMNNTVSTPVQFKKVTK